MIGALQDCRAFFYSRRGMKTGVVFLFLYLITESFVLAKNGSPIVAVSLQKALGSIQDATDSNTPGTLVKRDSHGTISVGLVRGNLEGEASLNIRKSGDSLSGHLLFQPGAHICLLTPSSGSITIQPPEILHDSYAFVLPQEGGKVGQCLCNVATGGELAWQYPVPRVTIHAYVGSDVLIEQTGVAQKVYFSEAAVAVPDVWNAEKSEFVTPEDGMFQVFSILCFDAKNKANRWYEVYKNDGPLAGYGSCWNSIGVPVFISGNILLKKGDRLSFWYTGRKGDTICARYTNISIQQLY